MTDKLTPFDEPNNFVTTIQVEAAEEYVRFIFTTIQPFCEHVTQREVKKKDLEQALIHYFPKHRTVRETENGIRFYDCPTCGGAIKSNQKFCDECGQNLQARD